MKKTALSLLFSILAFAACQAAKPIKILAIEIGRAHV